MVRMRKLLSVLIALSMLLSCAPAVLAEAVTVTITILNPATCTAPLRPTIMRWMLPPPTQVWPGWPRWSKPSGKRPGPAVAGLRRFHPGQHDLPV